MTWPSVRPHTLALVADYPPAAVFGPRTLSSCEFIWLLDGSAEWEWSRPGSGTEQVRLRPGMLALAGPGMHDQLRWDPDRPSRHAYVHFEVEPPGELPAVGAWPTARTMDDHPAISGLCSYLLELAELPEEVAAQRSREVITLLLLIFVDSPEQHTPATPNPHLAAVVDHVRQVWSTQLRIVAVAELCAATGLSAGHLHRLFREQFDCGPARALELIRLARAATALQRSNLTIAEIAAQTGFVNPYHFSRRFSGCYGLPPGAFRRSETDPYAPLRTAGLLPMAHQLGRLVTEVGRVGLEPTTQGL